MSISNVNTICINCMRDKADNDVCPYCGFDENQYEPAPYHLPPRSILGGKFLIGGVLGEDAFGITYQGWDLNLDLKIAVKEYYPARLVTRTNTTAPIVTPFTGEKTESFNIGRSRFVNQAKVLAKFYNLPGIVSVRDFFQENGTAYIVMEFVEGETLKQHLTRFGGKLPVDEVFELMRPLLRSLSEMHVAGLVHREISPDNILITPEGSVKLINFGVTGADLESGNRLLPELFHPGYSPEEQYSTRGQQGPWTDIYALCATIYCTITGITPPESVERLRHDELQAPSKLGVAISPAQEEVLLKGMAVSWNARWQNIPELFAAMYPKGARLVVSKKPESTGSKSESAFELDHVSQNVDATFATIRKKAAASLLFLKDIVHSAKEKLFPQIILPASDSEEEKALAIAKQKQSNQKRAIIFGAGVLILLTGILTISMFSNKQSALEKVDALEFEKAVAIFHRIPFGDKLFPKESAYVSAAKMVVDGSFSNAKFAFIALGDYREAPVAANESRYQEAMQYLSDRQYTLARAAFSLMPSYRDSAEQELYARYMYAKDFIATDQIDMAMRILLPLSTAGYEPAKTLIFNTYKTRAKALADENAFGAAYQELLRAVDFGDVSAQLIDYREQAYYKGVNAYRSGDYSDAKAQFDSIGDYLATNDYLYLVSLHAPSRKNNWKYNRIDASSRIDVDVPRLIRMIGFEDSTNLLLLNQTSAEEFLEGYWKGSGCYFKMTTDGHISYNLPFPNYGDYYEIKDGTMVLYPAKDSSATRDALEFTVLSEGCIEIFAFENCRTYTLYRT